MTTKVGDTVFRFDINNRVYAKSENGRTYGGPVFRGHFIAYVIVSEDKRSWIVSSDGTSNFTHKMSKTTLLTQAEVDDRCWVQENRRVVAGLVERCDDAAKLRAVAELLGGLSEKRD